MKVFKQLLCMAITACLLMSFASCGKREKRILYNMDLDDSVKVGNYKGLKVDTSSDEYKNYYDSELASDISSNELYDLKTEGKVFNGDIANIDYEGKKDGVAFDGGTAKGHDLTIGSGRFIPGFEEGLIGVDIGSTVNLNLTFPKDYDKADLAGKDVVFTVKVNEVKRPMTSESAAKKLGFKSEKAYLDDISERAAKSCLRDALFEGVEVTEYPEAEEKLMEPYLIRKINASYQSQYGITLDDYLSYVGQTLDQFKELLYEHELHPLMEEQMSLYYIFDKEGLSIPKDAVDKQMEKILSYKTMVSVTKEQLKEFYGEYYFEALAVDEVVLDLIYKNAKIK